MNNSGANVSQRTTVITAAVLQPMRKKNHINMTNVDMIPIKLYIVGFNKVH